LVGYTNKNAMKWACSHTNLSYCLEENIAYLLRQNDLNNKIDKVRLKNWPFSQRLS